MIARKQLRKKRLIIGSLNTVGQASSWARAVRTHALTDAESWCSGRVARSRLYNYPAERLLEESSISSPIGIAKIHLDAARHASHVVLESGRTIAGLGGGRYTLLSAIALRVAGCHPAIVFHGSELRSPLRNMKSRDESPFFGLDSEFVARLERQSKSVKKLISRWPFRLFVSTIDLLSEVPTATWLPVVPDDDWFAGMKPINVNATKPKVLHLPSSRELSNSTQIELVGNLLDAQGLIEFRTVTGLSPSDVRREVEWADIVIDKIGIGVYGVMAVQVMASGRLLIGDVDAITQERVPDLPLIQSSIATLESVIRDLVADRSTWDARAAAGQAFARKHHDGRYSAEVLARWMGVSVNQP